MHLKVLEDYIAELLKSRIDNRHEFIETSTVISRLMDIIIEEERRIPDFIVDGDRLGDNSAIQVFDDDPFQEDDYSWDDILIDDYDIQWSDKDLDGDNFIRDPGFSVPLGSFLFTVSSMEPMEGSFMRRFRWILVLIVGLLGFAVGVLVAP